MRERDGTDCKERAEEIVIEGDRGSGLEGAVREVRVKHQNCSCPSSRTSTNRSLSRLIPSIRHKSGPGTRSLSCLHICLM